MSTTENKNKASVPEKFRIVIPARYASTRLPGKVLLDIAGKPMIEHVWLLAQRSAADEVIIAVDDERVAEVVRDFGAEVVMTKAGHASGTDRIAEVASICAWNGSDIVVNVQGDEPLLPPEIIDQVATLLVQKANCDMATLCEPIRTRSELFDPGVVKVVASQYQCALYFSRAPIPWIRGLSDQPSANWPEGSIETVLRHVGIYAYRVGLLHRFAGWPVSSLESLEKLEQLRVLERGVGVALAQASATSVGGVDTETDLARIRVLLGSDQTADSE